MPYSGTKVYFDGSHYIAIPHTTRPPRRCRKVIDEDILEVDNNSLPLPENEEKQSIKEELENEINFDDFTEASEEDNKVFEEMEASKPETVKISRRELFDKFYMKSLDLPKKKRKKAILELMRPYFKKENQDSLESYVTRQIERREKNMAARRTRCYRKANLQDFNYFVTFTYSNEKHTEESFRKKLTIYLNNKSSRNGWRYIGVWERSPENQRLHFHGIFYIPEGTMPGIITQVNDYSFKSHNRQITMQNSYFLQNFGRNDFEAIEDKMLLSQSLIYIMKYIEKSGEKLVYSRGLYQYFISDIMDDDVICTCGLEDKKLLLYDKFQCLNDGEYVGEVSKETISKMPKSN